MNNKNNITTIILAAGEGKRMYSKTPKVLHEVCGKSMVNHVIQCAEIANVNEIILVLGHGVEMVSKHIGEYKYVLQENQLGTGHAVMQADEYIKDGDILVLCGDTPLLRSETIKDLYHIHKKGRYSATILTAGFDNPYSYGRIVRDENCEVSAIVEEKDASDEQKLIKEVNSGIYFFNAPELKAALKQLNNDNAQGEYYLTDVIAILKESGQRIGAYMIEDAHEIMGVNNRLQLSKASEIMRARIIENIMLSGVTIIDPKSTYIDSSVTIGQDVVIYPNCIIEGNTIIEEDCMIGPNTKIKDCKLGKGVKADNSVLNESTIGEQTKIGPFAFVRPGNNIGKFAKIGDFVEIKNSNFGDHSKASHLTYIGDGDVGNNVNLGCGVVFVNYNGKEKNRTCVGDNSFVGCNVNLVAPVKVGNNVYVAAGTTVTKDVPEGSLAVGRAKQENRLGWVSKRGLIKTED